MEKANYSCYYLLLPIFYFLLSVEWIKNGKKDDGPHHHLVNDRLHWDDFVKNKCRTQWCLWRPPIFLFEEAQELLDSEPSKKAVVVDHPKNCIARNKNNK